MSAYIPVELQRQIRTHFRDCCAYCRTAEALTVAIFEFEHIVPRSAGGETLFQNICLSCPTCNRYKASFQTALDPTTQQTVPLFHPLFSRLPLQLQAGETPGDRISGTGTTAFKVRLKNSDIRKGKSGGYRIIYQVASPTSIVLLTIYSKSDQTNISAAEIQQILTEFEQHSKGEETEEE